MAFFIGIDGGGTKTNLALADEKLNIIARRSAGSANPVILGPRKSASVVFKLIKDTVAKSKIPSVDSAVIGLAGCGRKKTADEVKREIETLLAKSKVRVKKLKIVSDAEITLEGAYRGGSGAILIAGTGSIAYTKNAKGKIFRSGGLGKILGDEGSGYSIGRKGLIAAAKSLDGRASETLLEKLLKKNYGILEIDSLITKVYSNEFDIAAVAEFVIKAAKLGDKVCRKILENEAEEIVNVVASLKEKTAARNLKLSFYGGLLSNENFYSNLVIKKIQSSIKGILLSEPAYPPELGAVLIAKKNNFTG